MDDMDFNTPEQMTIDDLQNPEQMTIEELLDS